MQVYLQYNILLHFSYSRVLASLLWVYFSYKAEHALKHFLEFVSCQKIQNI